MRVQSGTRSLRTRLLLAVRARRVRVGVRRLRRSATGRPSRAAGLGVAATFRRARETRRRRSGVVR